MRELTSSLLSFAWAQSLYAVQQMAQLGSSMMRNPFQIIGPPPRHSGATAGAGSLLGTHSAPIRVMMPEELSHPLVPREPEIEPAPPPQAPGWGPMP